jgi:RimJ/RimL family protein N-acetyltransferase
LPTLPEFTAQRLRLRPATREDLDVLWLIWADPEVRRYLFDDVPVTRQRATEVLADCLGLADGCGLWTVQCRDATPIIGCVGLMPVTTAAQYDPSLAGAVEPLAAFAPAEWHRGYAMESLAILVAYGFRALGLSRLVAVTDVPNVASDKLVRRLGFRVTGECDGPRYRLRTYVLTPDVFDASVLTHCES